ncbi:MAG: site-specific integrase [Anaerolineales bacterium]|nr:MAG: site-specific integrase [Anaerolineales bacterium]
MGASRSDQPSRLFLLSKSDLDRDTQEFLIDRQARNLTPKTLRWYRQSLDIFVPFCTAQGVDSLQSLESSHLRRFLVRLHGRGTCNESVL